tara:strand:- start:15837 stop:16100 length:264 start_codon:yes stop_codon:yes gene_type:complete
MQDCVIEKFQAQRDKLLTDFEETTNVVICDKKHFNFTHKTLPVSARITLSYGEEDLINRPNVVGMEVSFSSENQKPLSKQVEKKYKV